MIRKIEQTFDFEKLKRRTRGIINEQIITMYENADKRLQERLNRGVDYKNQKLQNLKKSTINIRRQKGISRVTPLIATGRLQKSIRMEKKGKKIGISFLKYGLHQAEGFTTNNHFAVKKSNKIVGYRDYSGGVSIPPRQWIDPVNPGRGLAINKDLAQRLIVKNLKKHLRGKVVHRF